MESEELSSPSSSRLSEIFKTAMRSPVPVRVLCFAHPFVNQSSSLLKRDKSIDKNSAIGIMPSSSVRQKDRTRIKRAGTHYEILPAVSQKTAQQHRNTSFQQETCHQCHYQKKQRQFKLLKHQKLRKRTKIGNSNFGKFGESLERDHIFFTPWPRNTRDFLLPPLIQFHGVEDSGDPAPEFQTILSTIRQAWYTPSARSQNSYSPGPENTASDTPLYAMSTNSSNFTQFDPNSKERVNAAAAIHLNMVSGMTAGNGNVIGSLAINGLLRRRYSVPEIIMRKHSLAQQQSCDESLAATAPSPNLSQSSDFTLCTVSSTQQRRGANISSGSDSNLNRAPEISMLKSTLLRRTWRRDLKRYDSRSGSWSPPLRRSQRRHYYTEPYDRCEECKQFDDPNGVEDASPKKQRLMPNRYENFERSLSITPSSTDRLASSSSERPQISSSNSGAIVSPSIKSQRSQIFMTSIELEHTHDPDMIHVEIEMTGDHRHDLNRNVPHKSVEEINTALSTSAADLSSNRTTVSSLDLFISKLLIENLNDLASEISQVYEKNCNWPSQETKTDSHTASSLSCNGNFKQNETFFQNYSLESKDLSSTHYTDNESPFDSLRTSNRKDIVQVNAGSSYPDANSSESLIVPRILKKYSRTVSMEVRASSASALEENGDESEKSESLVDSLEDLASLQTKETDEIEHQSHVAEKSEAFFILMNDPENRNKVIPEISKAMPEKIKERIIQRQKLLDLKREEEQLKKRNEDQVPYAKTTCPRNAAVEEKSEPEKSISDVIIPKTNKNNTALRTEIGQLESYTIDSKGNMQLRCHTQQKIQKTIDRCGLISAQNSTATNSVSSKKTSHNKKTNLKPANRNIQKMTILQAQSDIVTPDHENGPRRVYHKTEIQDGRKRIEILEIVECLEKSPEYSQQQQIPAINISQSAAATLTADSRHSRIPIPVYKVERSLAKYQKTTRGRLHEPSQMPEKPLASSAQRVVDRAIAELLIDALNRTDELGTKLPKSSKKLAATTSPTGSINYSHGHRQCPRRSASSGKYQQIFDVIPEERSSISVDSSNEESSKDGATETTKTINSATTTNCLNTTVEIPTTTSTKTITRNESHIMSFGQKTTFGSPKITTAFKTQSRGRAAVESIEPKAWIGFFKCHENDGSTEEEDVQSNNNYAASTTDSSQQYTISSPSTMTANPSTATPKPLSTAPTCPTSTESEKVLSLLDKTFNLGTPKTKSSEKLPQIISALAFTTTTPSYIVENDPKDNTCPSCSKKNHHEGTSSIGSTETAIKIELEKFTKDQFLPSVDTESSSEKSLTTFQSQALSESEPTLPIELIYQHRLSRKTSENLDIWRVQSPDICKHHIPKRIYQKSQSQQTECADDTTAQSGGAQTQAESTIGTDSKSFKIVKETPIENKCNICCFCNPDLHNNSREDYLQRCVYCNRKRTPLQREEGTNTEPDFFQLIPIYESLKKSDHTHTRMTSRDSDTISTKCTKIDEKIERSLPGIHHDNKVEADGTNKKKNLHRSKKNINCGIEANIKPAYRFSSPYANLSSNSYEVSNSTSSDSICPRTPPNRNVVCPPVFSHGTRGQNLAARQKNNKRRETEKHSFKHRNDILQTIPVDNANNKSSRKSAATSVKQSNRLNSAKWSLTLAGTYNQELAPDVEMRLSFPQNNQQHNFNKHKKLKELEIHQIADAEGRASLPSTIVGDGLNNTGNATTNNNGNLIYQAESLMSCEDILNENCNGRKQTNSQTRSHRNLQGELNPRRTLTRIISGTIERNHRDINFSDANTTAMVRGSKAIKQHVECSVVTSATRTFCNYARGRRTMSYHTLATDSHKTTNRDRHPIVRDHSLDVGLLSSRSHRTSCYSHRERTPSNCGEMMICSGLSVTGNAITPEQKKRVPTMSEKDLTRCHNACFIRNSSFFKRNSNGVS